jgi:HPt (histidine-containing phosphotransfer) domain-containing protein
MQRPGQPDLVAKVVGLYLDRAPGLVDEIGQAVERGDAAAIQSAAHSLKSSSANVGAGAVSESARLLEQLARGMDLGGVGKAFETLRQDFEPAASELRNHLPAASTSAQ